MYDSLDEMGQSLPLETRDAAFDDTCRLFDHDRLLKQRADDWRKGKKPKKRVFHSVNPAMVRTE